MFIDAITQRHTDPGLQLKLIRSFLSLSVSPCEFKSRRRPRRRLGRDESAAPRAATVACPGLHRRAMSLEWWWRIVRLLCPRLAALVRRRRGGGGRRGRYRCRQLGSGGPRLLRAADFRSQRNWTVLQRRRRQLASGWETPGRGRPCSSGCPPTCAPTSPRSPPALSDSRRRASPCRTAARRSKRRARASRGLEALRDGLLTQQLCRVLRSVGERLLRPANHLLAEEVAVNPTDADAPCPGARHRGGCPPPRPLGWRP